MRSNHSITTQKKKEFKKQWTAFQKQKVQEPEEFTGKFNYTLQNNFSQFPTISSREQKHNQHFLIYFLMAALP
jgi:hypothetical protein